MNVRIDIHNRTIEGRKEIVANEWEISNEDKRDIIEFLEDLELGKVNKGIKITESRQAKYLEPKSIRNNPYLIE